MSKPAQNVLIVQLSPGPEAFLVGGTVAKLVGQGDKVSVLTCSQSAELKQREIDNTELFQALMTLRVTDHRFLGSVNTARFGRRSNRIYTLNPDDGSIANPKDPLATEPIELPKLTTGPVQIAEILSIDVEHIEQLDEDLMVILSEVQPDAILLAMPEDISLAERIISGLLEQLAEDQNIPIHRFEWRNLPNKLNTTQVKLSDTEFENKQRAIASHHTKVRIVGESVLLRNGQTQAVQKVEHFKLYKSEDTPRGLFSRIILTVTVYLVAVFLTFIATLSHQASAQIAGILAPIGLIYGITIVTSFLLGCRLLSRSRLTYLAAGAAVITTIAILAFFGFAGSVLIPANLSGWIWLLGPTSIAILISLWPRITMLYPIDDNSDKQVSGNSD